MNFLKGSAFKVSLLSVRECVRACVRAITCPSTCLQGEDTTHRTEREREGETEEYLLTTAAGVSVMLILLSAIVLCVRISASVVCATEVIEAKDETLLSLSADKNEVDSDVVKRLPHLIPLLKAYGFIMGHLN